MRKKVTRREKKEKSARRNVKMREEGSKPEGTH